MCASGATRRIGNCPRTSVRRALLDLAATLKEKKAPLARLITTEMGKIFEEAEAEAEQCAAGSGLVCRARAANARGRTRPDGQR